MHLHELLTLGTDCWRSSRPRVRSEGAIIFVSPPTNATPSLRPASLSGLVDSFDSGESGTQNGRQVIDNNEGDVPAVYGDVLKIALCSVDAAARWCELRGAEVSAVGGLLLAVVNVFFSNFVLEFVLTNCISLFVLCRLTQNRKSRYLIGVAYFKF